MASVYLDRLAVERLGAGTPFSLAYIIRRVTSIDWKMLDLFYRLCGFEHFKQMFDLAERHGDEGPVANLGLITQYLRDSSMSVSRSSQPTCWSENIFQQVFFIPIFSHFSASGRANIENAEDPFPKGPHPIPDDPPGQRLGVPRCRARQSAANKIEVPTTVEQTRPPAILSARAG